MTTDVPTQRPEVEAEGYTGPERRRPGRREAVSPELIPLLRGEAGPVEDAPAGDDIVTAEPNQLHAVHGVGRGLMVSILVFWVPLIVWLFS